MKKLIAVIFGVVALALMMPQAVETAGFSSMGADGAAFGVESAPGTACTAIGTDAVCLGDGAVAGNAESDLGALAFGPRSIAIGINAVAIGEHTDATGANSIAIGGHTNDGSSADATGSEAIAIGVFSLADQSATVAVGRNADAGGTSALALGNGANASAASGIAIGFNADATGSDCIAIGGNSTDTDSADCSAESSIAMGQHVIADDVGSFAFAAVEFSARDTRRTIYHLVTQTTDDTQTELSTDNAAAGAANDISIASDCGVTVDILIHARQTNVDGQSAGYRVLAVLDNNAGTTALVGTASTTTIGEDVGAWDATISADDTNDGVNVLVTGAAGDNINWSAFAEVILSCG